MQNHPFPYLDHAWTVPRLIPTPSRPYLDINLDIYHDSRLLTYMEKGLIWLRGKALEFKTTHETDKHTS